MKARNKQEFLDQLGYELNRIGIDDTAEIFADFEEHFADSAMQGLSEEETAERLGDVKEIARSYLNLESSRINSMVARDIEHKKGVSLTKPGRSVPADLSLMKDKDIINSDNIREYTPEHFSEEIYPNRSGDNNGNINNNSGGGFGGNADDNSAGNVSGNADGNSGGENSQGAENSSEKSVADAFAGAGRAALDAAKITGHAIVDALGNSGVKDAVVGAGKSAAEAMKTAGHSAADAVKRARAEHEQHRAEQAQNQAEQADAVPHPSDEFRENINQTRTGTVPPQYTKANTTAGYKCIDVSGLKANVNAAKLAIAILLDCFLWCWLVPTLFGLVFGGVFGGSARVVFQALKALIGMGEFWKYYIPSRLLLFGGFAALAIMLVCIGVFLTNLLVKLIKFIINLHIKAIYDL